MKHSKQIRISGYAMLLALLCTASAITACGGDGETKESVTTEQKTAAITESETLGRWKDALPETLDLNGENIVVFTRGDEASVLEIDAQEEIGEVLNDAIFHRNRDLEERLNMTLKVQPGSTWQNYHQDLQLIRSSIAAGDNAWQIISVWGPFNSQLVLENCFYDLSEMSYLDPSAPWWNQSAVEALTIAGKRFLMAGDSSVLTMLGEAFVVFVNDTMCQKYDINDIHDLVRDGKWTLQKLTEYSKLAMADLDGSGTMDKTDQYGLLLVAGNAADSLYTAADIHQITLSDGLPVYDPDIERMSKLMEILYPLCYDGDMYGSYTYGAPIEQAFVSGQGLMAIHPLDHARTTFRGMEDSYTIVPLPKLDEAQENYYTPAYNGLGLQCIPADNPNPEAAAAVMEAMAAASHYEVTPVYFETCLQEKYARSEETVEMLEIIRQTQYVDVEFLWREALGDAAFTMRDMIIQKKSDVASWVAKKDKSVRASIENTIQLLEEMKNW